MVVPQHLVPRPVAVRHVRDRVLWIRFADGVEGEVHFDDALHGGLLAPLADPDVFATAALRDGVLTWRNGADWSPEDLYARVVAANPPDAPHSDDSLSEQPAYIGPMPEISRFFGIVIRMLANEHAPPHFHASYGEFEVAVTIADGVVTGRFPRRALLQVLSWAEMHEAELHANWELLRAGEAPRRIPPLD
jgi:hypothetical protein